MQIKWQYFRTLSTAYKASFPYIYQLFLPLILDFSSYTVRGHFGEIFLRKIHLEV